MTGSYNSSAERNLKNYFFQVEAKLRAVEAEEGGARVSRVAAMEAKGSLSAKQLSKQESICKSNSLSLEATLSIALFLSLSLSTYIHIAR